MKYPYTKILAVLLFFLFVALTILMFTGCGSKQKTVQSEKKEIEREQLVALVSELQTVLVANKTTNETIQTKNFVRLLEFEGKAGDSLVEETKHPDGTTTKRTWSGSGKVKESYTENNETKTAEVSQKETAAQQSRVALRQAEKVHESAFKKTKDKTVHDFTFSFWVWLWLLIVVVLILIYLNKRFKWLSGVTSFFNK